MSAGKRDDDEKSKRTDEGCSYGPDTLDSPGNNLQKIWLPRCHQLG